MTLANRLVGDWTEKALVIIERAGLRGQPRPLADILADLQDELYWPGRRESGLVLLSPGLLEQGQGFEAMVLDSDVSAARARAPRLAEKLLQAMRVEEALGAVS